jgi:soluble lytic murein transglycosylase-like protein
VTTLFLTLLVFFMPAGQAAFAQHGGGDTVVASDELICRAVEDSARQYQLPIPFLTRLVWTESAFQADAVSHAGAQGIAQFMPETASARGLLEPFNPQRALPKAAEYLAALINRFGNLGLAAAAYNNGPARVGRWLDGNGELAPQTRIYVVAVTGRPIEDWVDAQRQPLAMRPVSAAVADRSCMQEIDILSRGGRPSGFPSRVPPFEARLTSYLEKVLAQQTAAGTQ